MKHLTLTQMKNSNLSLALKVNQSLTPAPCPKAEKSCFQRLLSWTHRRLNMMLHNNSMCRISQSKSYAVGSGIIRSDIGEVL